MSNKWRQQQAQYKAEKKIPWEKQEIHIAADVKDVYAWPVGAGVSNLTPTRLMAIMKTFLQERHPPHTLLWHMELTGRGDLEIKDSCRGLVYDGHGLTVILDDITTHPQTQDYERFHLLRWRPPTVLEAFKEATKRKS